MQERINGASAEFRIQRPRMRGGFSLVWHALAAYEQGLFAAIGHWEAVAADVTQIAERVEAARLTLSPAAAA